MLIVLLIGVAVSLMVLLELLDGSPQVDAVSEVRDDRVR